MSIMGPAATATALEVGHETARTIAASRPITIDGIWIHTNATPCAHHCRYCQLDSIGVSKVPVDRFLAVVERFHAWRETAGRPDFTISPWYGNTHNMSLDAVRRLVEAGRRLNTPYDRLTMGGLKRLDERDLEAWLSERRDIGIRQVIISFAGHGETHDHWNRRSGDFEYLMTVQRIAAGLGLGVIQRIFLTRSILPTVERLLDRLDALGIAPVERTAFPLFYSGDARAYEDDRPTWDTLHAQPARLRQYYRDDHPNWRSERDWIATVEAEEDGPDSVSLFLKLDTGNLERIESLSCDTIVGTLEARTRAAYAALPGRRDLARMAGDPGNDRVYLFRHDMECKWLDRYLDRHPLDFPRHLTHLRTGG